MVCVCYTMLAMRTPVMLFAAAAVLLFLAAAIPGLARPALAAELREIKLNQQQYFVEVSLEFDKRPSYTDSFRYGPDRFLLTLNDCRQALPAGRAEQFADIDHNLLTRISVYQGAGNLALGFYVNQQVRPLVRYDDTRYFLRFYTAMRSELTMQLATGVSYSEKHSVYRGQNFTLYLVRVDPGIGAEIYSVAADRYDGKTRRRQVSSFARRELADVVVNGGFFGANGEHLSTLVEDGVVRATGVYPTRPMLVVTTDGLPLIGRFNIETALIVDGTRIPVSAKNYPFEPGKVMVYGHSYPIETLPQTGMFYYLLEGGKLRYYSASTSGLWLAPEVTLVATDIIPEANPLRQVPDGATVSLETRITEAGGVPVYARSAIGGAPMLVEDGQVSISVAEDKVRADISRSERSRTAVGLTRSGTLLIAVIKEQESEGFGGITLTALAELLIAEGAWTAMNLDGGGSSAIAVAGQLLNMAEAEERAVSNVLVVRAGGGTL